MLYSTSCKGLSAGSFFSTHFSKGGGRYTQTEKVDSHKFQGERLGLQQGCRRLRSGFYWMFDTRQGHMGRKELWAHWLAGADYPRCIRYSIAKRLSAVHQCLCGDSKKDREIGICCRCGPAVDLRWPWGTCRGVWLRCRPAAGVDRLWRRFRYGEAVPGARQARENTGFAETAGVSSDIRCFRRRSIPSTAWTFTALYLMSFMRSRTASFTTLCCAAPATPACSRCIF